MLHLYFPAQLFNTNVLITATAALCKSIDRYTSLYVVIFLRLPEGGAVAEAGRNVTRKKNIPSGHVNQYGGFLQSLMRKIDGLKIRHFLNSHIVLFPFVLWTFFTCDDQGGREENVALCG